jgi:predicted metal-binding membrane protein
MNPRHFSWIYPEWWSISLSAFAWGLMLRHAIQHGGHTRPHAGTFAQELSNWMLMVAAMMLPLIIDRVHAAAQSSLWSRRHRAMLGFLIGYFLPWLVLGATATLVPASWTHRYPVATLSFIVAALWQLTRMHKQAMMACHHTLPLSPDGWRADRDCLRFGAFIGLACVRSCWPLMLACAFSAHSFVVMTGGMAVSLVERWFWPRKGPMFASTLALAAYCGVSLLR